MKLQFNGDELNALICAIRDSERVINECIDGAADEATQQYWLNERSALLNVADRIVAALNVDVAVA